MSSTATWNDSKKSFDRTAKLSAARPDRERVHRFLERGPPYFVFPVPVREDAKYLIEVDRAERARLLAWVLNERRLRATDSAFEARGLHSDGTTPLLGLRRGAFRIALLPGVGDDDHARSVEGALSAALWDGDVDRARRLFRNQRACSSCEALGIAEAEVERRFEDAIGAARGIPRGAGVGGTSSGA